MIRRKAGNLTVLASLAAGILSAQAGPGQALPGEAIQPVSRSSLSPTDSSAFYGSVADGTASDQELPLTLEQAIQRGLKANLGLLVSGEGAESARGSRIVALSRLLPNLSARVSGSSQQTNLAAFGFTGFPGIQQIVGPFGIFDMRALLTQTILNLRALNNSRASDQDWKAAQLQVRDARDSVAMVVTGLYLEALAGAGRIEATQARVDAAEALFKQASDFKASGTVPAIDVIRARVELQSEQQRLIAYQSEHEKQKLRLGRAIGLPDGQKIALSDPMPTADSPHLSLDEALKEAYHGRMDYQSLQARVRASELRSKAAAAGRLPTLGFQGDYGTIGPSPADNHGTYSAAVSLNIPIFQGNRVKGEVAEAAAEQRKERAQLENLRNQIAYEIRTALLDIRSAWEQVEVTRSSVDLARQEEQQARDRFTAGVANNLEVVQAHQSLANANDTYINSLFSYNLAKASLARALGDTERNIPALLAGANH